MASLLPAGATVRVKVPASSANLGPGFDSFGVALGLYDEIECRLRPGGLAVEVTGEGAGEVSRDESHLVAASMRAAFNALGLRTDGFALHCINAIPHARGLGSSAAAIVGGVVAARALVADGMDLLPDAAALDIAAGIEGHPDNVAACLYGGFTIAWTDGARVRATRLEPSIGLVAVVFVPDTSLATERARRLLPAQVPHADAARNAARAGLLVAAIGQAPGLLLPATEDSLHQDYRAPAMPRSAELLGRLRAAGFAAVISGAGPTLLAITTEEHVASVLNVRHDGFTARRMGFAVGGATALVSHP